MPNKFYKGKFRPKNKSKYIGDINNIVYRSSWERAALKWCDDNDKIVRYGSEEVVIPYYCRTDGRKHRYFMDLYIETADGDTLLVEIKPKKQTRPPKKQKRKTKKYLTEVMTWAKNTSKWEAAENVAKSQGWKFQIWDEDTLKNLGIKIL